MNAMRWLILILAGAVCVTGCSKTKSRRGPDAVGPNGAASVQPAEMSVVPSASVSGRVASVNVPGQFVIVTFESGPMPVPDQKLNVYRGGMKVGEVKVSREQLGQNAAADIIAGEARVGDTVRPD